MTCWRCADWERDRNQKDTIGLAKILIVDTGQLALGAGNLLFTDSPDKRSLTGLDPTPILPTTPCEKRGDLWQSLSTCFSTQFSGFTIHSRGQPYSALWESFVSLPSVISQYDNGSSLGHHCA